MDQLQPGTRVSIPNGATGTIKKVREGIAIVLRDAQFVEHGATAWIKKVSLLKPIGTMREEIERRLRAAGFTDTTIYSTLPDLIESAIETIREFGWTHWEKSTTVGPKVKEVVKSFLVNVPTKNLVKQ